MTVKYLPSGDVQMVLMGPWGRLDLARVTGFAASPHDASFRTEPSADVYPAVRQIVGKQGTFYVYSTADDGSTRTHQIDGATVTGAHITGLVEFTYSKTRRI